MRRKFLALRYWLARKIWPEGHRGLDASNYPDLPDVAERWIVLDRGRWGTVGATRIGFGRVFVGVFNGYAQVGPGISFTRQQAEVLLTLFDDVWR